MIRDKRSGRHWTRVEPRHESSRDRQGMVLFSRSGRVSDNSRQVVCGDKEVVISGAGKHSLQMRQAGARVTRISVKGNLGH